MPVVRIWANSRRLSDLQADEYADRDQHGAGEERDAPAPGQKFRFRQPGRQGEGAGGEQQANRCAGLRQATEERFAPLRRVLDSHQHGAGEFAAEGDALHHAQQEQQHGRGQPDIGIGRQQTDQHGRAAHHHQAHHQHGLAPEPVAEMAEDQPPTGRAKNPAAKVLKAASEDVAASKLGKNSLLNTRAAAVP